MVNIIKTLLHPAGGHQGSHKAHQAGNQSLPALQLFFVFGVHQNRAYVASSLEALVHDRWDIYDFVRTEPGKWLNFV